METVSRENEQQCAIHIVMRCFSIKKSSNQARIGSGLRRNVYKRDDHKCLKCGQKENLSIDHIVPLSKGGLKAKFNLQTLCVSCNSQKGNRIASYLNSA